MASRCTRFLERRLQSPAVPRADRLVASHLLTAELGKSACSNDGVIIMAAKQMRDDKGATAQQGAEGGTTSGPTRQQLVDLLNEDLSREYQAIIAYVVYSQVLKGAQYMEIASQLELHARQELEHALIISRQVDYLGGMPSVTPKPVRTSDDAQTMLRFDLENENETIRNYRQRVRQCEECGEYAIAEQIRSILVQEQDHQIDLATALGVDVPDVTRPEERA
jgi:bacterioferritin